jgi:nucleotide-binding universal stress UspA family protein
MIAATLLGFAVAVFFLAGIGALLRRAVRVTERNMQNRLDRVLGDDRKLAAAVVAQRYKEAAAAGKTPIDHVVLAHPSGELIHVICAEDAAEEAQRILEEGE